MVTFVYVDHWRKGFLKTLALGIGFGLATVVQGGCDGGSTNEDKLHLAVKTNVIAFLLISTVLVVRGKLMPFVGWACADARLTIMLCWSKPVPDVVRTEPDNDELCVNACGVPLQLCYQCSLQACLERILT